MEFTGNQLCVFPTLSLLISPDNNHVKVTQSTCSLCTLYAVHCGGQSPSQVLSPETCRRSERKKLTRE